MPTGSNTVTLNVWVPQPLKRYVDRKVSSGVYGSANEFVRDAIREKRQRDEEPEQADAVLSAQLLDGLDSGTSFVFSKDYVKSKKRALIRCARKNRRA